MAVARQEIFDYTGPDYLNGFAEGLERMSAVERARVVAAASRDALLDEWDEDSLIVDTAYGPSFATESSRDIFIEEYGPEAIDTLLILREVRKAKRRLLALQEEMGEHTMGRTVIVRPLPEGGYPIRFRNALKQGDQLAAHSFRESVRAIKGTILKPPDLEHNLFTVYRRGVKTVRPLFYRNRGRWEVTPVGPDGTPRVNIEFDDNVPIATEELNPDDENFLLGEDLPQFERLVHGQ